ncbi:hypothetical protein C8J57DRAFT_293239 [Mycena rebaudengoi]|nr:hypothetical protein C8J57DRAFT_293239 [Mycena rebaudengoi]
MSDSRNGNLQGVKHHKNYFLTGGDLHFIVEGFEFCVHRYFFVRESPRFQKLLAVTSPGQAQQGNSHLTAIKLHDVLANDFEKFLWVFYNPTYSLYDATLADWSCILHLAHDWEFGEIVKLAVRELEKNAMSVVERIVLYQAHHVPEDILVPHYAALCARDVPLDLDEAERLGMTTVVLLNQTTHWIRKRRGGEECAAPADPATAALILKIAAHVEDGGDQAGDSTGKKSGTGEDPKKRAAPNGANGTGAGKAGVRK